MDAPGIAIRSTIYLVGVAVMVVGALGLIDIVSIHVALAVLLFIGGSGIVVGVHERLGGPI